jgi:UPF0755 protein
LKRILILSALVIVGIGAYIGFKIYINLFSVNTPFRLENDILYIPGGSSIESIIDSLTLHGQILSEVRFRWAAEKMKFDDEAIKRGRYIIPAASNNKNIISMLRGGRQKPLQVTIHNVRTIEQLSGRMEDKFEFDSLQFLQFVEQSLDTLAGTTPPTRLTIFLPNTYEFYWTASPEEVCRRMKKEHDRFWTEERRAKALALGLTTAEVYTLASIIEKETNYDPEKPRMAGVYLNRIREGIPLQADPTVVFAHGDFEIRRILFGHLEIDSPYNTYKNPGLPPGPIFMPGIASIDAVLNREEHDYLYFCARPTEDGPGHAFASTLPEHNQNAQRYQKWLDTRGIQ